MARKKSIISPTPGEQFHRWTVLAIVNQGKRQQQVLCRCECGRELVRRYVCLRNGTSKSCGCWAREQAQTHGDAGHDARAPEYCSWCSMKSRCLNPRSKFFSSYGGRGIEVCDRWQRSYEAFLSDMGRKPTPHHSLDRIDNDGDYEPGNCRWADKRRQARNRRSNLLLTVNGETLSLAEWAERTGTPVQTLQSRLSYGWTPEEAVLTPRIPGKHVHRPQQGDKRDAQR